MSGRSAQRTITRAAARTPHHCASSNSDTPPTSVCTTAVDGCTNALRLIARDVATPVEEFVARR
jgi:hypothetical protein